MGRWNQAHNQIIRACDQEDRKTAESQHCGSTILQENFKKKSNLPAYENNLGKFANPQSPVCTLSYIITSGSTAQGVSTLFLKKKKKVHSVHNPGSWDSTDPRVFLCKWALTSQMHPSFLWAQGPHVMSSCSLQDRSYAARVRTAVWTSLTQSQETWNETELRLFPAQGHIHICLSNSTSNLVSQRPPAWLNYLGDRTLQDESPGKQPQVTGDSAVWQERVTRKFFRTMVIRVAPKGVTQFSYFKRSCVQSHCLRKVTQMIHFLFKKVNVKMITGGQIFFLFPPT